MKHFNSLTIMICILTLGLSNSAFGRVWRVNNNPAYNQPSTEVFSSLQQAVSSNAVLDGDILYVEASATNYGNIILSKRLTLIGPGYFLNENTGLQANPVSAIITLLTLTTGSNGSEIYGLEFFGNVNSSILIDSSISNIVISRCKLASRITVATNAGNISDVVVSKNYLQGISVTGNGTSTISNMIVTNNYFSGASTGNGGAFELKLNANAIITQNVIQGAVDINGAAFFNNICLFTSTANNYFLQNNNSTGNIYNNIFRRTAISWLAGGNNNFGIASDAYMFANTADTSDKKYILKPQSQCPECYQGFPSNIQMGIYGGADPYKPSGIPAIPAIYTLQSTTNATQGGTLSVTIRSRSNN